MPTHPEAVQLLADVGFSSPHQRFAAWNLLALASLRPDDAWSDAQPEARTVNTGIMEFISNEHGKYYRTNTRESFRKALRDMEAVGLVVRNAGDNTIPVHSKHNTWGLAPRFARAVKVYDSKPQWRAAIAQLEGVYAPELARSSLASQAVLADDGSPMRLPTGAILQTSSDRHGTLVKLIIEQLLPQLGDSGAKLLYADPGSNLPKFIDAAGLERAGVREPPMDNRPDVVATEPSGQIWVIECVDSLGHVTEERRTSRMDLIRKGRPVSFVTAYESRRQAKQPFNSFAPGTYVWFASEASKGLLRV